MIGDWLGNERIFATSRSNVARGRVTRRRRHKGAESVLWRCFRCRDRVCWPGVGLAAARRPVSVDRVGDDAGVHGNRRARKPAAVCTETGRSARTASRRSKLFALLSSRLSHMRPVRRLRVAPFSSLSVRQSLSRSVVQSFSRSVLVRCSSVAEFLAGVAR